jgi:Gene product 88
MKSRLAIAPSRTLSKNQALAICGSLSEPGKMPGHGYSLPAEKCRLGSFLRQFPNAVCTRCYALRGRYVFIVVRRALEKRLRSLSHPLWVAALTYLIRRSGDSHFRWHDSGDLQGMQHLCKIVAVCKNLPEVKFWLPTREYQTVEAYLRSGGEIPRNLCIRYSAHLIDGR